VSYPGRKLQKYIIGRTASRTGINGKKLLRTPKHSMTEVVEPEEEEEENEEEEEKKNVDFYSLCFLLCRTKTKQTLQHNKIPRTSRLCLYSKRLFQLLPQTPPKYLLTYLLHGAESFLRS
jgi:hypothetical protein